MVMSLNNPLLLYYTLLLVAVYVSDPSRPAFINNTTTPSLLLFVPSSSDIVRSYSPVFNAMPLPSRINGALPSPPTVEMSSAAAAPFAAGCCYHREEGPERPGVIV